LYGGRSMRQNEGTLLLFCSFPLLIMPCLKGPNLKAREI
jgi:hypothetical protein